MDLLLGSYINTLMSKGISFEKSRRKIVVVFTKADRIRHLPPNLQHYREEDPIWAAINTRGSVAQMEASHMQEYIEVMGHVSDAIKEWITRDAFGKSFVRLAASKNIDLRFSLISSTGEGVNSDGTMVSKLAPRRVLDPYFWALEMQSEIS